jgi:hypothetical protein
MGASFLERCELWCWACNTARGCQTAQNHAMSVKKKKKARLIHRAILRCQPNSDHVPDLTFLYKECLNSARTAQPRKTGLQKESGGMKQEAGVTECFILLLRLLRRWFERKLRFQYVSTSEPRFESGASRIRKGMNRLHCEVRYAIEKGRL